MGLDRSVAQGRGRTKETRKPGAKVKDGRTNSIGTQAQLVNLDSISDYVK